MGLFSGVLGNASSMSNREAQKELELILTNCEEVQAAYKLVRDLMVFTDKRFIMVDKQGLTGKKTTFHSIPFKSISHFSIETAGHFDLDAELKIWISGAQLPAVSKKFKRDQAIFEIQKILASVCM